MAKTDVNPVDAQKEHAAKALSEHFGVTHIPGDILGTRPETTGDLIAVTRFGNKVRVTSDGVEVLTGPGKPADPDIYQPPELAEPDNAEDLPPLEGHAADDVDVEPQADGPNKIEALSKQTMSELKAIADEREIEVPAKARKAELVAAIAAQTS